MFSPDELNKIILDAISDPALKDEPITSCLYPVAVAVERAVLDSDEVKRALEYYRFMHQLVR